MRRVSKIKSPFDIKRGKGLIPNYFEATLYPRVKFGEDLSAEVKKLE